MAAKKESQINDVINTTESIKKAGKSDNQLQSEQLKRARGIAGCPTKKFKCSSIYAALYPDGFVSSYQTIPIYLVFDNRTIELPEPVYNYVTRKLQKKADDEADKLNRYRTMARENLGTRQAD